MNNPEEGDADGAERGCASGGASSATRTFRGAIETKARTKGGGVVGRVLEARQLLSQGIARFQIPNTSPGYAYSGEIVRGLGGNLWFTDGNNDISKITTKGKVTTYNLSSNSSVSGLTLGADGNIWFIDNDSSGNSTTSAIGRITPAGAVTEFRQPETIEALASGPGGDVWFTGFDSTNSFVGHISADGRVTQTAIDPSDSISLGTLAADRAGNLWISITAYGLDGSVTNSGLLKISPTGHTTELQVPKVLSKSNLSPYSVTRGSDGNVWFTTSYGFLTTNLIGRVTPSGRFRIFRVFGQKAQYIPGSIAAGPHKSLLFAVTDTNWDTGPNAQPVLGQVSASGRVRFTELPKRIDDSGENIGISGANDLTMGPDGNLWLVSMNWSSGGLEVDRVSMSH